MKKGQAGKFEKVGEFDEKDIAKNEGKAGGKVKKRKNEKKVEGEYKRAKR